MAHDIELGELGEAELAAQQVLGEARLGHVELRQVDR
jgi:hypothetical protein